MSDHLPILPVLLPSATAIVLLLIGDGGGLAQGKRALPRRRWARRIALASALLGAVFAFRLVELAPTGVLTVYRLGDWPAPFGIVLVIDRLSALMLVLTSAVAVPVLWYASGGWDAQGRHFHALFQFQLMGLNGAFVTGDIFNLFVFFEVLLIASYVLMMHGLGRERLRAGVHYVVLNLAASALFLIGVALIYALTGTLNLADLALRVPLVSGPESRGAAGRGADPAGGVRLQGGAGAAGDVAAGHLRGVERAGGGAVRDHDQGRRLRHPARARRRLRRRRRRLGLHGAALAAAAGAERPAWSACSARWRRTRCRA